MLDNLFVHRLRTAEGKDGNPLNEVRVICGSPLENGGALAADKQIKLKPEASVLGYEVGDTIALDEEGFRRMPVPAARSSTRAPGARPSSAVSAPTTAGG